MRTLCILLLVVFCGGLVEAAQARETPGVRVQMYALFMGDNKVGWTRKTQVASVNGVTTMWEFELRSGPGAAPAPVWQQDSYGETADGQPKEFRYGSAQGSHEFSVHGTIAVGSVLLEGFENGIQYTRRQDWPQGAILMEAQRKLAAKMGLKEGTRYTFDSYSMRALGVSHHEVAVGPKVTVDVLGKKTQLTQVTETVTDSEGSTSQVDYVDEAGWPIKMTYNRYGVDLEAVACDFQFARGDEGWEAEIKSCVLTAPAALVEAGTAPSIVYQLQECASRKANRPADAKPAATKAGAKTKAKAPPPPPPPVSIPSTASQKVTKAGGVFTVTVQAATLPSGATFPYPGQDAALRQAMSATQHLQCLDKDVVEMARQAVGQTQDAADAVGAIDKAVRALLAPQPLDRSFASAGEIVRRKEGDSADYAVLTAAMLRAVGIPSRLACGLVFRGDNAAAKFVLTPQMWAEAYVVDRWVGVDPASGNCDARRITLLVCENPQRFLEILPIAQRLQLTGATPNP